MLPEASNQPIKVGHELIKQELNMFYQTGGKEKSKYLLALHESLAGIPPTIVEPERSFSATGLFATKIRSRLGDDSLDVLLFLRQYFRREKQL